MCFSFCVTVWHIPLYSTNEFKWKIHSLAFLMTEVMLTELCRNSTDTRDMKNEYIDNGSV